MVLDLAWVFRIQQMDDLIITQYWHGRSHNVVGANRQKFWAKTMTEEKVKLLSFLF